MVEKSTRWGFSEMSAYGVLVAFVLLYAGQAWAATTQAEVPVASWIDALEATSTPIAVAIFSGLILKVAGPIAGPILSFIGMKRIEQLIERALEYGFNATRGALRHQTLSIELGNEVIAKAANYAIAHAPSLVKMLIGSPERLKEKIIARMQELPPEYATAGVVAEVS